MIVIDYEGKFGDQKPTHQQRAILERQGIREDVIATLTRQEAYQLIKQGISRWLQEREDAAVKRRQRQARLNRS